ncbi:unnamed protein product [Ectocarpus sp. 13 AM-2016]
MSVVAIIAYSVWLCYKAAEKAKSPGTSFVLTNEVNKNPDLWICLCNNYGCDEWNSRKGAWIPRGRPKGAYRTRSSTRESNWTSYKKQRPRNYESKLSLQTPIITARETTWRTGEASV